MIAALPPHPVADKVAGIISRRLAPEYAKHGAHLRNVYCTRITGSVYDCRLIIMRGNSRSCVEALFQWVYVYPKALAVDPNTMRPCPNRASSGPPA